LQIPPKKQCRHDSCSGATATPPDSRKPFPPFSFQKPMSISSCQIPVKMAIHRTLEDEQKPQQWHSRNPSHRPIFGSQLKHLHLCITKSAQTCAHSRVSATRPELSLIIPVISLATDFMPNTAPALALRQHFRLSKSCKKWFPWLWMSIILGRAFG
jgi:hypothetical protein